MNGTSQIIEVGETATQTLSGGVTIAGEVAKWSDSDQKLHLIHIDTSDDKFHNFLTGTNITISGGNKRPADSAYSVTAIVQENKISANEQNTDFGTIGGGFLDFSENNPFGDPENN